MGTDDLSLNPSIRSAETNEFQKELRARIIGQDEGVQSLVELFQVFTAGLNSPGRPVGNLLLLARRYCLAALEPSPRLIARNFSTRTRSPS